MWKHALNAYRQIKKIVTNLCIFISSLPLASCCLRWVQPFKGISIWSKLTFELLHAWRGWLRWDRLLLLLNLRLWLNFRWLHVRREQFWHISHHLVDVQASREGILQKPSCRSWAHLLHKLADVRHGWSICLLLCWWFRNHVNDLPFLFIWIELVTRSFSYSRSSVARCRQTFERLQPSWNWTDLCLSCDQPWA